VQICLCHVNVAIDLPGLPQIPAPVTDQSCAATSSANTLIGVGCPHAPPSCANLHSARRSRRHRLPFPAGSFIEGFRTPATVQAASLRSAGIRNPQHSRTYGDQVGMSAKPKPEVAACAAALRIPLCHSTFKSLWLNRPAAPTISPAYPQEVRRPQGPRAARLRQARWVFIKTTLRITRV
jgi:hypothetical protein